MVLSFVAVVLSFRLLYLWGYEKHVLSTFKPHPDFVYDETKWGFIDWRPGMTYNEYKLQAFNSRRHINGFCNKTWLLTWYKEHGIPGPKIIQIGDRRMAETVSGLQNYCIKPDHLSEGVGIIIVKDGKITNTPDIRRCNESFVSKFKPGHRVKTEDIDSLIRYYGRAKATWDSSAREHCIPRGAIVEEIHDGPEIKIFVILGKAVAYYFTPSWNFLFIPKTFDIIRACKLAENTALKAGIDVVRIDIVRHADEDYRVSEFTYNPDPLGGLKFPSV